jgi:hypothetical protein
MIVSDKELYINEAHFEIEHLTCGTRFILSHMSNRKRFECPNEKCKGYSESNGEIEIGNFLIANDINIDKCDRKILDGKEIDILANNLGIEYDGIYWHSELANKKKNINYHLKKTELAKSKGVALIHVFQNEWELKQSIVKSVLLSKLNKHENNYYARKCTIKEIDNKTKDIFLENNHLQGKDKSSYKLGLFYEEELVSVMTFGKRKITGSVPKLELMRFCNKINTRVIGGASKLLKHFIRTYEPEEIISYADRRYSDGTFYEKLGFTLEHVSSPNYWYFRNNDTLKLFHRSKFMKHKLINILEDYDETKTEWENMVANNYNRIWDCGNFVYKLTLR